MMAKLTISKDGCKGCGLCISVCPKKILALSKEINTKGYHPAEIVDQGACIACAFCATICPDTAITVEK